MNADQTGEPSVWIVGEGIFEVVRPVDQDETIGSILQRLGGIPAGKSEVEAHQAGKELTHLKLKWLHKNRMVTLYFGRDDARIWNSKLALGDHINILRNPMVWVGKMDRRLIPRRPEAEQAGSGQPATRPESKSEGGDNPQPESEERSR